MIFIRPYKLPDSLEEGKKDYIKKQAALTKKSGFMKSTRIIIVSVAGIVAAV